MAISFKYWNDCVDPLDMEAMWLDPDVSTEWIGVGETIGSNVHLSRDPDGKPYLTQTEMKAVAGITVRRHFVSLLDPDMICAIAVLESDRQPLATRYEKKTKATSMGIMQIFPKTADWLVSELGYKEYEVEGNPTLLYRPFVSVYLGAAYLKWLSNYDQKVRSEEFVVRAYSGGTKKATSKSTLPYWRRYLSVKASLPSRKKFEDAPLLNAASACITTVPKNSGELFTYWDSRASLEDMEAMWNHPDVVKEWTKSKEKRGTVRFSQDETKRPYLSRVQVKAVAEIILFKHFITKGVKPTVLCALAEMVSMRFIDGSGTRLGLMGIDYPTATWLYEELGYKGYRVTSANDLTMPFISMYFGAAYLDWLSEYEGRERTPQFVVEAYLSGPKNVNVQETGPLWLRFKDTVSNYEDSSTTEREEGSCTIL